MRSWPKCPRHAAAARQGDARARGRGEGALRPAGHQGAVGRRGADLDAIAPYAGIADRFLLDAKPPKGAELPGGNGIAFDWRLLEGLSGEVDYLLSGGLDAANVGAALSLVSPPGLDLSSGVETAPGVKDPALITQFFAAVRAARATSPA
jgi:phosphoribosylanthranilate isomerase